MINKTLDVIIAFYNGEKWIDEAIDSLLTQTFSIQNIFIIDDGSKEEAYRHVEALASKHETVHVLRNSYDDGGCSSARLTGLERSSADYVAMLDQDDVWHKDHFHALVNALEDHPDVFAAASYHKCFQDGEEPIHDVSSTDCEKVDMWDIYPMSRSHEPSLFLFRREKLKSFPFYTEIPGFADYVLTFQINLKSPFLRINMHSCARRIHETSAFSKMRKDPLMLAEQWVDVSQNVLQYRFKNIGDDKREYWESRQSIIKGLYGILNALVHRQAILFFKSCHVIEKAINNDGPKILEEAMTEVWDSVRKVSEYQDLPEKQFMSL